MAVVVDSSASLRREHVLLSELQEASKANLKGIYVLPARGRSDVWEGVVFPRSGPLRGGVFRFQIEFSLKYPFEGPPKVKFLLPDMFHPCVSETGELDLSSSFPKWFPFQHKLPQLLSTILSLLSSSSPPSLSPPSHPLVVLFQTDEKTYFEKGRECVERSKREIEKEEGGGGEREEGRGEGFVFGGVGEEEAGAVLEYLEKFRGRRGVGRE